MTREWEVTIRQCDGVVFRSCSSSGSVTAFEEVSLLILAIFFSRDVYSSKIESSGD